jgi:serine/alanine adding enzyme
MKYKLLSGIEEVDREKWESFVAGHPQGSVFQSPDMYDLYATVESYSPMVMALEDQYGSLKIIILAVIIHDYKGLMGKLSSRTLIYGGPLIDPKEKRPEDLTEQLLDSLIKEVRHKSLYIQIRNLFDLSVFEPIFRRKSFVKQDHLNQIVATTNSKETLSGISKSKIRQARQSFIKGAEIVVASNEEEIIEFYKLLEIMYRTRVRKPLPPESFFISFFRASLQGKLGLILIAKYQGKVIGGMVCPITPGKALNEWYICGLDKAHQQIHPSVMLTYGAIDYALNNDIPSFDFMGIGSPDIPYGVRDFKTRFGGKTVNYGRFLRVNNQVVYSIAKLGYFILAFFRLLSFKQPATRNRQSL